MAAFLAGTLTQCRTTSASSVKDDVADTAPATTPDVGRLCVGSRGNGVKIVSHFHALARLVELYGLPQGIVGGSSGSIMAFFYESILVNPSLNQCAGKACTPAQLRGRVSLLLKSLQGYLIDQPASAVADAANLRKLLGVKSIFQDVTDARTAPVTTTSGGFLSRLLDAERARFTAAQTAAQQLEQVGEALAKSDLQSFLGPEPMQLLEDAARRGSLKLFKTRLQIVTDAAKTFGQFSGNITRDSGKLLFLRPALISFPALATVLGRVADFYAGRNYGDDYRQALQTFFDTCADSGVGKDWHAVTNPDDPSGQRCAGLYDQLLQTHPGAGTDPSRLDEAIGLNADQTPFGAPLTTLVMDTVLNADGGFADSYLAARADFLNTNATDFVFDLDRLGFGFWGQDQVLAGISDQFARAAQAGQLDEKSKRFRPMWDATWREILSLSPAEPGSSPAQLLHPPASVSGTWFGAGGWSDHLATQQMRAMGCDTVALLTRPGDEKFSKAMLNALSKDDAQVAQVYNDVFDFTNTATIANTANNGNQGGDPPLFAGGGPSALAASDIVSCFDWDSTAYSTSLPGLTKMGLDAYQAPIVINTAAAGKAAALRQQAGALATTQPLLGCSLGAR